MSTPMHPVISSNISYIGFDENGLYVTFKTGKTYNYPDVPKEVYEELKNAPSVGKYYMANIRGKYEGREI